MCRIPFVKFLSPYISTFYAYLQQSISSAADIENQKKSKNIFGSVKK